MSSITDAYIKAFDPKVIVTAKDLSNGTTHKTILKDVEKVLKYRYMTLLDADTGNLYIGKKV